MTVLVVMGVSGSGKTAVGSAVAHRLGWGFVDADDHHSDRNRNKMAAGLPLTDADRGPWLDELNRILYTAADDVVLACSALTRSYRDRLTRGVDESVVVFLQADPDVVAERVRRRSGHFMPSELVASQFDTLEVPDRSEALTIDADRPIDDVISDVVSYVT